MKNNNWKTQRTLKGKDIPTKEELIGIAKSIKNLRDRALFIVLYLTAARVTEVVPTKYLRKVTYQKKVVTDELGNKQIRVVRNKNGSPIFKKIEKIPINYEGIRKSNINQIWRNGRKIVVFGIQNRKNKKNKRKSIPVPVDKEKEFIEMLYEYLDKLQAEEPLFRFGVKGAEGKLIRLTKINPHFLRDIRLTRLVVDYNFNAHKLKIYAGWEDVRPAEHYVRLNPMDIIGGDY